MYHVKKVGEVLEGKWKPEDTKWGMKEGVIQLSLLNPAVPADEAKLFEAKKAEIVSGKFQPFTGPSRTTKLRSAFQPGRCFQKMSCGL